MAEPGSEARFRGLEIVDADVPLMPNELKILRVNLSASTTAD
jgi:hypothetical protein